MTNHKPSPSQPLQSDAPSAKTAWHDDARILSTLMILAVTAAYAPSFFAPFYFDDHVAIIYNDTIKSFDNLGRLFDIYTVGRGLTQLTFMIDWRLYDGYPWGFHITNLALHTGVCFLAWLATALTLQQFIPNITQIESRRFSFIGALIFSVHALNTESITYISSRSGVLAAFCFLASFSASLLHLKRINAAAVFSRRSIIQHAILSLILVAGIGIGLGAKETIVTLPIMFFLFFCLAFRQDSITTNAKRILLIAIPIFIFFTHYFLLRWLRFGGVIGFDDFYARSPWSNLYSQASVIGGYYFPRVLLPIGLNLDPDIPLIETIGQAAGHPSVHVALALVAAGIYSLRRFPVLGFGILWFFVTIAPTSSFIPLFDLAAERRTYLPMIGVCIAISSIAYWLSQVHWKNMARWAIPVCVGYALILGALTFQRNQEYVDPIQFWRQAALNSPGKVRPACKFMKCLLNEGKIAEAQKVIADEYLGVSMKSRNIERIDDLEFLVGFMLPNNLYSGYIIQIAEQFAGHYSNSIRHQEVLQLAYLLTGRFEEFEEVVNRSYEMDNTSLATLQNHAYVALLKNDLVSAKNSLERACLMRPNSLPAHQELAAVMDQLDMDTTKVRERINFLSAATQRSGNDEMLYVGLKVKGGALENFAQ